MFKIEDAYNVASYLNVKFDDFSINDLLTGMNIELEHGQMFEETNITNDNPIMTAKIALAHLNEFPDYYNDKYGLPRFEDFLKSKKSNI